ncbi:MAG: polysaccharide biosynthesis protein [Eubacteriales bacterium]|nr:polysaccharide biosynthesis protein [Eubacteriales bacterium]
MHAIEKLKSRNRKIYLLIIDIFIFLCEGVVCILLRDMDDLTFANRFIALLALTICVFIYRIILQVYRQIWRYAGAAEYLNIVLADICGGVTYIALSRLVPFFAPIWIMFWQALSIVALGSLCSLSIRFIYQCWYRIEKGKAIQSIVPFANHEFTEGDGKPEAAYKDASPNKINIAIVGAGIVGAMLARELLLNKNAHYRPYCFVDKDPQKIDNLIAGLRVYPEEGIIERLQKLPVQEIIIALPNLPGAEKRRLFDFYHQSECKVKLYDYAFSMEADDNAKRALREFSIEDLLFRDVIRFNDQEVLPTYQGKTILVTGGGGSIGSELCRQLARLQPGRLIIFDIYENNAYEIEQELIRKYGARLTLNVEIGSVRDEERLKELFAAYRPQIVFHAAAHKHVPLMEHSGGEALKNNVFGTLQAANIAEMYGVERFLLVSTDKAVNPTSVMGASKRLCEMIIQSKKDSPTNFVAVRFGNVLGSNGSVIPLFKQQIASGGPLTLTDKRIIRYFMTIPEAAQLLLRTCALAQPGEIYVLDMGMPVKILDLAENMIRLSGLTPYVDIDIQEIGLRPGEKLYEELLMKTEELDKTENKMIFIERDQPLAKEQLNEKLEILRQSLASHDQEAIIRAMRQTVPTFHSATEVNRLAEQTEEMMACRALDADVLQGN